MSEVEPSLFDLYSFDTSAFINGRKSLFLPTSFGAIWDGIAVLANQGVVRAVDEVKRELARKEDETYTWAKGVKGLFTPLHEDIQIATSAVLAAHPKLLGIGGRRDRNAADPFVVALALARGGTVVTQEEPRDLNKPRIPDVCDAMNVPWMTLPQFVDAQDWKITLG
ncbi:MAG: DUF4411 family protein [Marmoricola sp.]